MNDTDRQKLLQSIRELIMSEPEHLHWRLDILLSTLIRISAFNDDNASDFLAKTGKYSLFDEPASAKIARDALEILQNGNRDNYQHGV